MASEPKNLDVIIKAMFDGMTEKTLSAPVREHFHNYVAENKGDLVDKLPDWWKKLDKDRGDGKIAVKDSDEEFIKGSWYNKPAKDPFDVLDEEANLEKIEAFAKDLEKSDPKSLSQDIIVTKIINLTTDGLGMDVKDKVTQSMANSLAKKCIEVAGIHPIKKPDATVNKPDATVKQPDATVKQPDATVKQPDATVKQPDVVTPKPAWWEVKLNDMKAKAAVSLNDAEKKIKEIDEYASKIPGKAQGADEILKILNQRGKQLTEAEADLVKNDRSDLAEGLDSLYRGTIIPSLQNTRDTQIALIEIREDLSDKLASIKSYKKQIDALKTEDDIIAMGGKDKIEDGFNKIDDTLTDMDVLLTQIKTGEDSAEKIINAASKHAAAAINEIKASDVFKHYSGHGADLQKSMLALGGGHKENLLTQLVGTTADGQTSPVEGALNTVRHGIGRAGEWWHNTKMGARTQNERNILNLTEQVALGFGGLLLLNTTNSMFFGGQMPAAIKWGAIACLVGYLVHRSGETGHEMVRAAETRSGVGQNSFRNMPTLSTYKAKSGAADDHKDASNKDAPKTEDLTKETILIKDPATGKFVKNIEFEYATNKVTIQSARGGVPDDKIPNLTNLKVGDPTVIKGVSPALIAAIKAESEDAVIDAYGNLAGSGKNIPADLLPPSIKVDIRVDEIKINQVPHLKLGADALTARVIIGNDDMVKILAEHQAEKLDQQPGMTGT